MCHFLKVVAEQSQLAKGVFQVMLATQHRFSLRDLVGGHPALDFVNTVTSWGADPVDWLDSYGALLEWAVCASLLELPERNRLRQLARRAPADAAAALERSRCLRGVLYLVLRGMIDKRAKLPLEDLSAAWREAVLSARLVVGDEGLQLLCDADTSGFDLVSHRVALASVKLLESFPFARARICAGSNCGWVYIDRSKAGRRVWCDMRTCGNTAKSRRHYAKQRAKVEPRPASVAKATKGACPITEIPRDAAQPFARPEPPSGRSGTAASRRQLSLRFPMTGEQKLPFVKPRHRPQTELD